MKTVLFQMGDIRVDGVEGFFSQTNKNTFCHIHHCILHADGIGCKKREFIGSVPKGVYGDPAQGISPKGNDHFGEMVEAAIQRYIDAGKAV